MFIKKSHQANPGCKNIFLHLTRGGGGGYAEIFYGRDKNVTICFIGLIKCWGGGYDKIFHGLEHITSLANYMWLTCSMPEKSMA